MDLTLAYSPALLVALVAAAAALAAWAYRRTTPPIGPGLRVGLGLLRFAALALVLFLIFEPILRRTETDEQPPVLAVLVDRSESLTVTGDTSAAPSDAVREALSALDDPRADRYGFAADLTPLTSADTITFDGARTDIAQALERVEQRYQGRNLRGVVVVSDGRYTAGRNPLYLAERYPVPVYTVVAGDSMGRRDVAIQRVLTNDVAYAGAPLPFEIGVRVEGYGGERVEVSLYDGDRRVARTSLVLPEAGEATVELDHTPTTPGLRRYTAAVTRLDGELTLRNNAETVAVQVLDQKRRVLLVGGAPGPDLAAFARALGDDPDVEVVRRTQRAAGQFYEGALPELSELDAAVLVGFPGPVADAATAERIAEAAAEGLPLLYILSGSADLSALGRHFADVLPAVPERVRPAFSEAEADVTGAGAAHPILRRLAPSAADLARLPPARISDSRWSLAPDAQVLATVRVQGVPLSDPLLAVRRRGRQRAAMLLGADTWRWFNLPPGLAEVDGLAAGLTANLLRWTTTREDRRPVRVRPLRPLFGEGERVELVGQVVDEALQPIADAEIAVTVTAADGTDTTLPMRPRGAGRYVLDAGSLPPGAYEFAARAVREGEALGDDAGAFAVGALALEFREPGADPALMRALARRSGGETVALADLAGLPERLATEGRLTSLQIETERQTPLGHVGWLLAVVVGLLAAEWVLRKRAGMV